MEQDRDEPHQPKFRESYHTDEYRDSISHEPCWTIKVIPRKLTTWQGLAWAKRYYHDELKGSVPGTGAGWRSRISAGHAPLAPPGRGRQEPSGAIEWENRFSRRVARRATPRSRPSSRWPVRPATC